MLQRVKIEGINFPRLYIAENMDDVLIARQNGIPYVRWKYGQEELIKQLLRPVLEKMFPGINWSAVLGPKKAVRSLVYRVNGYIADDLGNVSEYDSEEMLNAQYEYDKTVDQLGHDSANPNVDGEYTRNVDIARSTRECIANNEAFGYQRFNEDRLRIQDYVGDLSSCVDIDALQKLGLLPKFVGDITDCIKRNISQSMHWNEGYTKKLGYPLGKFDRKPELPNLLIIDVSHSIPDGVAATMLTLADTLRSQCNAELIITSRRSGYYPSGAELPKPQTLRDYYGRSNESSEFWAIIKDHIAGREFGHVISFGDFDSPGDHHGDVSMIGTKVHMVHHYHTNAKDETGYARWVKYCCPNVVEVFDTSWCKVINRKYKM